MISGKSIDSADSCVEINRYVREYESLSPVTLALGVTTKYGICLLLEKGFR